MSAAFVIDQLFPTKRIHLISGASGVGKTTFLLQLLNDWTVGKDVLGRKSFPVPWCYINCARSLSEITGKIEGCEFTNLHPENFEVLPYDPSLPEDVSFEGALKAARTKVPGLKLLVLDAISVLARGKTNEDGVVAGFMRMIQDKCMREDLTVIGTGVPAKGAEGPRRARISGSVSWGTHAGTMLVLEGDEDSLDRTLRIFGDFAPETWNYEFGSDGKFILTTDNSVAEGALDMKLDSLQPGDEFETSIALQWAKDIGCSRPTAMRWLKQRVEDGRLEKVKRGTYKLKFTA